MSFEYKQNHTNFLMLFGIRSLLNCVIKCIQFIAFISNSIYPGVLLFVYLCLVSIVKFAFLPDMWKCNLDIYVMPLWTMDQKLDK